MRILLDSCIWGGTIAPLLAQGYDVDWCGYWESDPGDEQILAVAFERSSVLITIDKDFGELAILHNKPHCGIVRLVEMSVREQAQICDFVLQKYKSELADGAIITAYIDRVRVRLGDQKN